MHRNILKKPHLRKRAALLATGVGASVALGAGIAAAADSGAAAAPLSSLSPSTDHALAAQADAQQKAADQARAKAAEAAKKAASWTAPVDRVQLGEPYGAAGSHWSHRHSGQDFVVPTGTPVHAAHGGTVVKAGPNGGGDGPAYGNAVVIRNAEGVYTQYAHLSRIDVGVGRHVTTGQEIGLSGSTGNSTGPHLHFEVRYGPDYGQSVEPTTFLHAHGVRI
ncbi:M23 family metallopeptidase [Streptomyces sp. NPDC059740]|uniref:M23 family metallopeptidase n=1 Tax=Streptomyces sp. NPDC059740 TaxID=3346926 RepID=UPI00365665A1